MAINGAIRVEFDEVLPHGAYVVGDVQPVKDWDRSTREVEQQVVERDEHGEPVLDGDGLALRHWQVEVMDGDRSLRRDKTFLVRIVSARQPVPPEPVGDSPFAPVELVGLSVGFRIARQACRGPWKGEAHQCRARQVFEFHATDLRPVSKGKAPGAATASVGNGRAGSG